MIGRLLTTWLPTRRAALLLAALSPLWLLSFSRVGAVVAGAIFALALAAIVIDAILTPGEPLFDAEREAPASIGLGDREQGMYRFRSRWPLPVRVRLYDHFPAAVTRDGGTNVVVPALGSAELPFGVTGAARGVHPLGPLAVRVTGPLRLGVRTLRYEPGDAMRVAPSAEGIRRYRLLALQHRLRDAGVRAIRRRGEGSNFSNLREYARGDDPRKIDWKATARRGRAITREYTVEQGQTILIAIDAGRMMTQLAGDRSRFEHALAAALVLADVAATTGDLVGLLVFDDEVRAFVPPARGSDGVRAIRDALVSVRATMVEPDYAAAFRVLATKQRKRSLVVLFTDVIDVRASAAVIAHTTRDTTRHLPLVVALRNDELVEAASPRDGAAAATLYGSAAAEELLAARDEALWKMRRAGVSVLDVSPKTMAAAVINRYLEVKARAAI